MTSRSREALREVALSPRRRGGPGRDGPDMAPRGRPEAAAMPKRGARKRLKFRADDVCSERGEDAGRGWRGARPCEGTGLAGPAAWPGSGGARRWER